eukprot:766513-Hanusia_phi.AAC.7
MGARASVPPVHPLTPARLREQLELELEMKTLFADINSAILNARSHTCELDPGVVDLVQSTTA